ncbi:hypothetical protein B9Z55_018325 [Caenorhabditis nigoni]|uniref:Cilia- and flagella-associated protein 36 n=1 Tax=Caenorhabditis nigoni TaxID=1611254 RepID=A0A2G5TDC7_9PELO|nr:hypothetical protein B9Z55_018325 [Caenorhabditis nigoni]
MLRRFSKKNRNPPDGATGSTNDNERKYKKLVKKFLEFITSPVWSIPIASFIEGQSVVDKILISLMSAEIIELKVSISANSKIPVFDRAQMETEVYIEIHKEYSQLIDTLIECFCEDVGTTPAELIEAIKTINQQDISHHYKRSIGGRPK